NGSPQKQELSDDDNGSAACSIITIETPREGTDMPRIQYLDISGFKKSLGSCDAERETRMHRRGSEDIEHRAEVPTDRTAALDVVLHTAERDGGESEADAALGSAIHAHAVLRKPTHGDCAGTAGMDGQSQTDSATHAAYGHRSDLSETAAVGSCARSSDLSVPAARSGNHATQSSLEHGY